jgi:hypothetical protein
LPIAGICLSVGFSNLESQIADRRDLPGTALIEALDRLWPRIEQALLSGERVVEIR